MKLQILWLHNLLRSCSKGISQNNQTKIKFDIWAESRTIGLSKRYVICTKRVWLTTWRYWKKKHKQNWREFQRVMTIEEKQCYPLYFSLQLMAGKSGPILSIGKRKPQNNIGATLRTKSRKLSKILKERGISWPFWQNWPISTMNPSWQTFSSTTSWTSNKRICWIRKS